MPEAVTTRAALLPAAGTPLRVVELDVAPPGPGEVRVRLHASGVCSDDLNAIDGSVEIPCPVVPGHEGAGVVEEVGAGVRGLAVGDHVALSWAPYCGTCEQCLRDLPHLCGTAWPLMLAGGMLDGTTRLSFGGATVHHYCFLSSFAERAVVPERSCIRIPAEVPFEIAALAGCAVTSGVGAVWRTAGVRPGERVAVFGLGGAGMSAVLGALVTGASHIV
ncbi:MAG TPA: alcohol dehydrogenase catalytic domain-containing protein, partial [Gaiellales bacterium]|nr:alcohol dehydrogenase catalytic domain-containing protein [Gaiellales bacterium]